LTPSKAASIQATAFESNIASAGAGIVSAEFFLEQFVAMDDAGAAFDVGFRRKSSSTFTHGFEKRIRRNGVGA